MQVGVPRSIAYNMTFPDIVSKHNIDSMRLLVQVYTIIYIYIYICIFELH